LRLAATTDHHIVAAVSISGISLDVLGGLYLAYDLLGGQHGPLRLLTRIVTYSIVFGIGYGLGLGLFFGVVSGAATGITIAIELHRMGSRNNHYSLPWQALFSAIRGVAFGAGLYRTLDFSYAATFRGSHHDGTNRRLLKRYAAQHGLFCSPAIAADAPTDLGQRYANRGVHRSGIGVQHAGAARGSSLDLRDSSGRGDGIGDYGGRNGQPLIEYYADNLPVRRLGVFGICLVLCGLALQSFQ